LGKVFKALSKAGEVPGVDSQWTPEQTVFQPSAPQVSSPQAGESPASSPPEAGAPSSPPPRVEPERTLFRPASEAEGSLNAWDSKLVASTEASSWIAESFRRLRAKIVHPESGPPIRTILVTSSVPQEGKSFVCANLGITLSQSVERHALLVDCDLRRSSLAELFGLPNDRGVVNHLQDGTDLARLIRKTGMRKLSLIPAGPRPLNPAELLDSKKMIAMIDELSSRYSDRYILLDTPPMQAASETAVLAKHVDGVVVVVRWGLPARNLVKELTEAIGRDKIIGVVFNAYEENVLEEKIRSYGYGHYEKYYSAGQ